MPIEHHELHSGEDWQEVFQAKAQRTRKRHESAGCFGVFLIGLTFVTLLLLSGEETFAWYWAFIGLAAGVAALVWLRPAPWPKCPACSRSFSRLGGYCPSCGKELGGEASAKRAKCAGCEYEMSIVSKAPSYKYGSQRSSGYKFKLVPVNYCTFCKARLGDGG